MSAKDMKKQPTVPAWILAQPPAVEPSWAKILLTTLSLWLSRNLRGGMTRPFAFFMFCVPALFLGTLAAVSTKPLAQQILALISVVALWLDLVYVIPSLVRRVRRAQGRHRRIRTGLAQFSARSLTILAAVLAGRGGSALLQEWTAHLAGESGHDAASWDKVKQSAGFIIAGISHRCSNWADAAWRPVDAVLRSRFLSGLFVVIPTIVVAVEVLTHKGAMTVLTSWGSIFCVGTGLAAAIKAGRKYRDVEPPKPKARQARKEDRGT